MLTIVIAHAVVLFWFFIVLHWCFGPVEWVFSGGHMLDEVCLMLAFVSRLLAASGVGCCDVGGGVVFLSPNIFAQSILSL